MSIDTILYDEIRSEIENLQGMEKGSESYTKAVDGVTKLLSKAIEMDKNENDLQMRADELDLKIKQSEADLQMREKELELKKKQLVKDKTDRWLKIGIDIVSIAVPTAVTIWGTLASLKFEEEGTITTIIGRGFINKLLPKK